MFAYCGNNPVIREDDGGEFWNIVIGAAVGGVVNGLISIATQAIENQGFDNINWASVAVSTVAGAVSGALAATGVPVGGQMVANGIIGAISSGIDTYLDKGDDATITDYVSSTIVGGALGVAGGFLGGDGTGTKHLSRSAGRFLKKAANACVDIMDAGLKTTGKIISNAWKYYYSQVAKQSIQCGTQAILPIVISNIPNAVYSTWEAMN